MNPWIPVTIAAIGVIVSTLAAVGIVMKNVKKNSFEAGGHAREHKEIADDIRNLKYETKTHTVEISEIRESLAVNTALLQESNRRQETMDKKLDRILEKSEGTL